MGFLKKLKKLKKKSLGGKLISKGLSHDPVGRKLVSKDPIGRKALGMDGEGGSRRRRGPLAELAGRIAKPRQTGGPGQKSTTGPNMRHMITGGGAQRTPVGNTGVVGPRQTGGGGQKSALTPKPPGRSNYALNLSRMAGSRNRLGVRR